MFVSKYNGEYMKRMDKVKGIHREEIWVVILSRYNREYIKRMYEAKGGSEWKIHEV